ncbi:MAG: right-handed parallel beta-helix repeat-containing protein [Verrucomicrobia bacterium]|nr:right-handed parallel beta-helix repeat-containing protein [Verrucomicrobiota bacterium]
MKTMSVILLVWLLHAVAHAAILRVGAGREHARIQSAIDAASPGDTVEVAPGIYPENVTVTKGPLVLLGAGYAADAGTRLPGEPDPATESVVAPVSGDAIVIASGGGAVRISGFVMEGGPAAGAGVVRTGGAAVPGAEFSNNLVVVRAGFEGAALRIDRDADNLTVSGCVFRVPATSARAVELAGGCSFDGFRFNGNQVRRTGGQRVGIGLSVEGNRNAGAGVMGYPEIRGNVFAGHAIGLDAGTRALLGAGISDNLFSGNLEGMVGGPKDCLIRDNEWMDNTGCGIRFTSGGETADISYGASGCDVRGNRFSGNGTGPGGGADMVFDVQPAGTTDTNVVRENRFLGATAVVGHDPSASLRATHNYWGAADGPGGAAPGGGGSVTANVIYQPYYGDDGLTVLNYGTGALDGELTVGDGQTLVADALTLGAASTLSIEDGGTLRVGRLTMPGGSNLSVRRGTAMVAMLEMEPGAVLDVVDGNLSLDPGEDGNFHTIGGTFTFFNCMGSLWINGNTSFSGDTLGIASDIHVAPGSVMQVLGKLSLDGCRIECPGTFSLLVNYGAVFSLARCEIRGAAVSLVGSDATLRDNVFAASSVTAFSTVSGARIYHNVFGGGLGLLRILPGAVVTTTVEGWGNVSAVGQVSNKLALRFRPSSAPGRTLDADGSLYVQPGDMVDVGLDIGGLNATTQAAEVLLGYDTDYLGSGALVPSAGWENGLYLEADESAVIGRLDAAVGLTFSTANPDGTTDAGPVADLRMVAKPLEGRTRMFFRTKDAGDHPLIDTRLTASAAGMPYFKESPFLSNSATLTVDGTAPVFAPGATAVQVGEGGPADVLESGVLTRMGTVTVTFDVADGLAGIGPGGIRAELSGTGGSLPGSLTGSGAVVTDGVEYSRCVFSFVIGASTPDGVYDVNGIATDRSGNTGVLAIGALEVAKNRLSVTVQPQGLVASPVTRNVTFTATGATGDVLASWTVPVSFSGGQGGVELDRVPDGTAFLSAKMAWNLRVRQPVALDAEGRGVNSFTNSSRLRGGDLNGDNLVNLSDYNILRGVFNTVSGQADITGDGMVNLSDYNILRANWFTLGDPL